MAGKFRFLSIACAIVAMPTHSLAFESETVGSVYDAFDDDEPKTLEPPLPGTVTSAIQDALAHNPQIRVAEAQKDASKANRFRALGGFLPEIEATASYTDDRWRSDSFQTLNESDGTTVGVTAVQPIFQGLSAINRFRAARARVTQSDLILISALHQTALEAARAHAGVILARAIVEHRVENMGLVNKQLLVAQKRASAGAQSRTGVEQARMRLAQAQVDLGEARTRLAQHEAAFVRITGRSPATDLIPDTSEHDASFETLENAVAAARANNPGIGAAEVATKAARHDKSAAVGVFAPKLTLEGSYQKHYGVGQLAATQEDEEYQLVARVRVPLFRQGSNIAGMREANASVAQQQAQAIATQLAIEEIVRRSWRQLSEARARSVAAASGIEAAKQSVRGLEMEYSAGQRSVIDVLDGQRDLVTAQINASQSEYEVRVSQYELSAATGNIFEAFALMRDKP